MDLEVDEVGLELVALDEAGLPRAREGREAAAGRGEVERGHHLVRIGDEMIDSRRGRRDWAE